MFCIRCGSEVSGANFCPVCGTVVGDRHTSPAHGANYTTSYHTYEPRDAAYRSDRDRWIACALCFFLGVIGAHRFYVGKIGTGILYLFTGGIFGIGALVDLIMILCGTFRDCYDRPLV